MNFISSITDRMLSLALCGLTAFSGLPRLSCVCAAADECDACVQGMSCVACASSPVSERKCCCHKQDQEPTVGDGVSGRNHGGCNCEKFTEQTVLSAVPRFEDGQADHFDLAAIESYPALRSNAPAPSCEILSHRPPDDPVSRCQILRL